jgi:hypothetical protein
MATQVQDFVKPVHFMDWRADKYDRNGLANDSRRERRFRINVRQI